MQSNQAETEPVVNGQPKEKKENFFVESKKLLEQYIQDRILLIKLEASKKAATTTAGIVTGVVLGLLAVFALVFVSITLGFVFSELTGSFIWGFGIVSAIYIALIITVILAKKWLGRKVSNAVISSIYSKKKQEKQTEDGNYSAKN
jgi:hypothetical protein